MFVTITRVALNSAQPKEKEAFATSRVMLAADGANKVTLVFEYNAAALLSATFIALSGALLSLL